MRDMTCECGNKFKYQTINNFIECHKCKEILPAIPTIEEYTDETEMSEENGTSI